MGAEVNSSHGRGKQQGEEEGDAGEEAPMVRPKNEHCQKGKTRDSGRRRLVLKAFVLVIVVGVIVGVVVAVLLSRRERGGGNRTDASKLGGTDPPPPLQDQASTNEPAGSPLTPSPTYEPRERVHVQTGPPSRRPTINPTLKPSQQPVRTASLPESFRYPYDPSLGWSKQKEIVRDDLSKALVAFSPDGKCLAVGFVSDSVNDTVEVYELVKERWELKRTVEYRGKIRFGMKMSSCGLLWTGLALVDGGGQLILQTWVNESEAQEHGTFGNNLDTHATDGNSFEVDWDVEERPDGSVVMVIGYPYYSPYRGDAAVGKVDLVVMNQSIVETKSIYTGKWAYTRMGMSVVLQGDVVVVGGLNFGRAFDDQNAPPKNAGIAQVISIHPSSDIYSSDLLYFEGSILNATRVAIDGDMMAVLVSWPATNVYTFHWRSNEWKSMGDPLVYEPNVQSWTVHLALKNGRLVFGGQRSSRNHATGIVIYQWTKDSVWTEIGSLQTYDVPKLDGFADDLAFAGDQLAVTEGRGPSGTFAVRLYAAISQQRDSADFSPTVHGPLVLEEQILHDGTCEEVHLDIRESLLAIAWSEDGSENDVLEVYQRDGNSWTGLFAGRVPKVGRPPALRIISSTSVVIVGTFRSGSMYKISLADGNVEEVSMEGVRVGFDAWTDEGVSATNVALGLPNCGRFDSGCAKVLSSDTSYGIETVYSSPLSFTSMGLSVAKMSDNYLAVAGCSNKATIVPPPGAGLLAIVNLSTTTTIGNMTYIEPTQSSCVNVRVAANEDIVAFGIVTFQKVEVQAFKFGEQGLRTYGKRLVTYPGYGHERWHIGLDDDRIVLAGSGVVLRDSHGGPHPQPGYVDVYEHQGDEWIKSAGVFKGVDGDNFGRGLAFSGGILAVSANLPDNGTVVHVHSLGMST